MHDVTIAAYAAQLQRVNGVLNKTDQMLGANQPMQILIGDAAGVDLHRLDSSHGVDYCKATDECLLAVKAVLVTYRDRLRVMIRDEARS